MATDPLDRLRSEARRLLNRRRYRKNDTLFHEGDAGDLLYVIERGRVAIRVSTSLGDPVTLAVLAPGDLFGEQALLSSHATRTASAIALEPVEVLTLHRRDFNDLRQRDASIDSMLIDLLVEQVRRVTDRLQEALYVPADGRVLRRLLDLTELYANGDTTVDIPLRQDDIAAMAGTTRPTVNRLLRRLEEDRVVELRRGHIVVLDKQALTRLAR